jgi:hypothetical protein
MPKRVIFNITQNDLSASLQIPENRDIDLWRGRVGTQCIAEAAHLFTEIYSVPGEFLVLESFHVS